MQKGNPVDSALPTLETGEILNGDVIHSGFSSIVRGTRALHFSDPPDEYFHNFLQIFIISNSGVISKYDV